MLKRTINIVYGISSTSFKALAIKFIKHEGKKISTKSFKEILFYCDSKINKRNFNLIFDLAL